MVVAEDNNEVHDEIADLTPAYTYDPHLKEEVDDEFEDEDDEDDADLDEEDDDDEDEVSAEEIA